MPRDTKERLTCACGRAPTLAFYGYDKNGEPYVHLKVFKQRRVYGEIVARGGVVEIYCPNCERPTRVRMSVGGTHIVRPPATARECLPQAPD
ncbi:hypothetical protein Mbo2_009 [Rhodococcus phage Mbo2]|uniref:Uncharacterized protein n=1 Tax=Rhodococcus phage Mbo2 TaxID=2936911 RepID=A0A9E7LH48_9CAUD|nr:hypothetical protein Mbo2_009 [Rhodococcus phage Mbo2]